MLIWSTAAPAVGAAFLASLVEVVEAFTIVLAVATLRGWRPAALGAAAALALLAGAVLLLGPLLNHIPLHALQLQDPVNQEKRITVAQQRLNLVDVQRAAAGRGLH